MTLTTFFPSVTAAIIADPTINRGALGDMLQAIAPTLNNAESNGWYDALADMYESLGIINSAGFASWRNEIVNEGDVVANKLFVALSNEWAALPESVEAEAAVALEANIQALAAIPGSIAILEAARDAQSDFDLTQAYNAGIQVLQFREQELTTLIGQ